MTIEDMTENLFEDVFDFSLEDIDSAEVKRKIRLALARYAITALMDSKVAIEAENVLMENER